MDVNALRTWGIGVSGALMAASLAIALQTPQRAEAQMAAREIIELAQAPSVAAAPISFIVRFRGSGPIARAQARASRGDTALAQREVELQLRRQDAFSGLCFDRFTVGGAETVLRTCASIVASERADVQQSWLTRLRAMRAVEYADANATATQNRAG